MMLFEGPFRYRELLQGGPLGNFRRICLCVGVNVMQQFTGWALLFSDVCTGLIFLSEPT